MAEYTNATTVTVPAGQNVPFTETAVCGSNCIVHREGAGNVTLRGITKQCRARYKVSFGGNIAVPADGTAEAISVALAVDGEPLNSTIATVTPAAVSDFFNVFTAVFVDVPCGCCVTVAVENTGTQSISVANANLIVERVS